MSRRPYDLTSIIGAVIGALTVALVLAAVYWFLPVRPHCLLANWDVTLIRNWDCPGIGILEVELSPKGLDAESTVRIAGFGLAAPGDVTRVTADTRFNIASLTKQFTGMALAILSTSGDVQLDHAVAQYLPEFQKSDITVAQLLYHTAGLPDYLEICAEASRVTNADILNYANQASRLFAPGTNFEYSNTGYALLAMIVERVSGMSFPTWISSFIFKPLEMHDSYFMPQSGQVEVKAEGPSTPIAFYRDDPEQAACDVVWGDGGLISTLADYAKWLREVSDPTHLPDPAVRLALTPGRLRDGTPIPYGFGWMITDEEIQHEGSWAGFSSLVIYDRDTRSWNAAFSNFSGYDLSKIIDDYWLRESDDL